MHPRWAGCWLACAGLLLCPARAYAHSPIKGLDEIFNGLLHPLTTPVHLILLVVLSLRLGQHSPFRPKWPMLAWLIASAVGLGLTLGPWTVGIPQSMLLALVLGVGLLVATGRRVASWISLVLFATAALLIGLDSGLDSASLLAVLKTLLGTWLALALIVFDLGYYVSLGIARPWVRIGVRVLGSWSVAIAVLMLALSLRP